MHRATLLLVTLLVTVLAPAPTPADSEVWSEAYLDYVLERYVTEEGRVRYGELIDDRMALDRYVEALAMISPESHPQLFSSRDHELAYWMNAYNALMLHRVVEAWPTTSVRKIRKAYGVFWREKHELGGRKMTLRALENKVIRPYGDPRIHFAINCASVGCPALPRAAWKPDTLDEDLERAARRFIAEPANVRVDADRNTIHLSSIFKWFTEDFTEWLEAQGIEHPRGIQDYVERYLPDAERGKGDADRRVEWIEYDWSINAAD